MTCQEGRIVLLLGYSSFNIQVAGFDCEFDSLGLQVSFSLCSTMHISGLISEGPLANLARQSAVGSRGSGRPCPSPTPPALLKTARLHS